METDREIAMTTYRFRVLYATADPVTPLSYIGGINNWNLYYFLSKIDRYRDRFNLRSARDLSTCCA